MNQSSPPVDPALIDEAAQWLARSRSPHFTESDAEALQQWRSTSATHDYIWNRALEIDQSFGSVPADVGMSVLDRRRTSSRRGMLKMLGALTLAPSAGWWLYRSPTAQALRADLRTGIGERHTVQLDGTTRVELNTASAIDVQANSLAISIRLIDGEILLDSSGAGTRTPPPCEINTAHASVSSVGARIMVRCDAGYTDLAVLEGMATAATASTAERFTVPAGQKVRITPSGTGELTPLPDGADGWVMGVLFADRTRLDPFLAELARYRRGIIRCDPAIAGLPVSGAFQLKDPDEILRLLARSLPIRIQQRTPYWINVTAA